ncbi:MAG TPA: VWA domain-containing protein, partial [Thermoanaerobaculia bacterium]|nr:VWA domain-containing protein [Thermoanaerobaculia bacterium]
MSGNEPLVERWRGAWPKALDAWSSYTLLRDPRFFESDDEAAPQGWGGEIAAIRLTDQTVGVNLATIRAKGLEENALAVLAHEVGHHVYVPGNLADNARMQATMRRVLTGLPPSAASLVSNLYADLLINDRLQRRVGLDMAGVYRKLKVKDSESGVWKIYTRICEILWRLPEGSLAPKGVTRQMDADAELGARLIRSFAGDWLRGTRRFASLLYPYLAEDEAKKNEQTFVTSGLSDMRDAGKSAPGGDDADAIPDGLTGVDPWEESDDDAFDDDILDPLGEKRRKKPAKPGGVPTKEAAPSAGRQFREPFEYGELLKSLGLNLSEHEVTTRYYRERALPYLIPFPVRKAPQATEPLAEGYEVWEGGDPLEDLDLLGSVMSSPVLVPGVSTVKRVYGE